ncbi:MoeA family protein [Aquiflexum balticum]|uniref:hypothetical protein n=1 Tax=Aquiflexum balticum TaxID=280473 RepID=UPI0021CDB652|nr:hypothetical protein [Aquiflexum balticum]
MISVNQAMSILQACVTEGKIQLIPLLQSMDLIVAKDILSPLDVLSFDNSAIDGDALGWDENRESWEVMNEISAGEQKTFPLQPCKPVEPSQAHLCLKPLIQ